MWRASEQKVYFSRVNVAFKCKDRDRIVHSSMHIACRLALL